MKKNIIAATLLAAAASGCPAGAQTVVNLHFTQNPLFEVSTHEVTAAIPDDSTGLTLGGDLVISGGSGTYAYLWTDPAGKEAGDSETLYVTEPGVYTLTVSDQCDCSHEVLFDVSSAGIDAAQADGVSVSFDGSDLIIEGAEVAQVSVFSKSGQMVRLFTSGRQLDIISLKELASDVYVAQVVLADGRVVIRKIQVN